MWGSSSISDTTPDTTVITCFEGGGFSVVIKQLGGERSWRDVAGIWADDTEYLQAAIEDGLEGSRDQRERIREDLSE